MFALLEIERIYKALKLCWLAKFAYHFRINYDLNLETAEFHALGLYDFGETLLNARHLYALYVAERFSQKNAGNSRFSTQTSKGRGIITTWHILQIDLYVIHSMC